MIFLKSKDILNSVSKSNLASLTFPELKHQIGLIRVYTIFGSRKGKARTVKII